jgi:hypothetical protein
MKDRIMVNILSHWVKDDGEIRWAVQMYNKSITF